MVVKEEILVNILARVLYEVERHSVSIEKAFKKACSTYKCPRDINTREFIYEKSREFIRDSLKLRCLVGEETSRRKLAKIFIKDPSIKNTDIHLDPWCKYSVPQWFYEELRSLLGEDETQKLLLSMEKRFYWLRINTLKAPEEKTLRLLEKDGIVVEKDKDLWYLYKVLNYKKPLRQSEAIRNYYAILQDKASCLVVEALRPEKDDKILDMAAAPGIKTSLIAMLTEDEAKIVAEDLSRKRIYVMKHLLKKLGVKKSIDVVLADGRYSPHRPGSFNKILIDAPCSSSGALGKDPAIRISLIKKDKVSYYAKIQENMLSKALELGDEIVYAVCSLLPEEGEEILLKFSGIVSFEKILEKFSRGYKRYREHNYFVRTFPHKDFSEGFFIAKMKRL
ncbi:MAG: RsmB/NOP family class I SAM-dependent RNA methyltransferase [Sulfolobales archaeon]